MEIDWSLTEKYTKNDMKNLRSHSILQCPCYIYQTLTHSKYMLLINITQYYNYTVTMTPENKVTFIREKSQQNHYKMYWVLLINDMYLL